jgi:hypothetical protein
VRLDLYGYVLGDTNATPARAFWFTAYNTDMCVNPGQDYGNPTDKTQIPIPDTNAKKQTFLTPLDPCSMGGTGWRSTDLAAEGRAMRPAEYDATPPALA